MSISAVSSSSSVLENALAAALTSTNQTTTVNPAPNAASSPASSGSGTVVQDLVTLLKDLGSGDTTGAKTDLAKLKADWAAQLALEAKAATSSDLGKNISSLLNDLHSNNTSAAKADVTKIQTDLKTANSSSSTQTATPLDTLLRQISDSLSSGNIGGALQELTAYLAQSGQSTGNLINMSG